MDKSFLKRSLLVDTTMSGGVVGKATLNWGSGLGESFSGCPLVGVVWSSLAGPLWHGKRWTQKMMCRITGFLSAPWHVTCLKLHIPTPITKIMDNNFREHCFLCWAGPENIKWLGLVMVCMQKNNKENNQGGIFKKKNDCSKPPGVQRTQPKQRMRVKVGSNPSWKKTWFFWTVSRANLEEIHVRIQTPKKVKGSQQNNEGKLISDLENNNSLFDIHFFVSFCTTLCRSVHLVSIPYSILSVKCP